MFIYTDIVADFACEMCGTCCRNHWQVTLDETSYRRNQVLFGSTGRQSEFAQAFIKLQEAPGYGEYAYIAKQDDGKCWFLDNNNCCRLHKEAGHHHLDAVCQTYPRYPMSSSRGIELTLSFSCPTVLKLADREQPIAIIKEKEPPTVFPEKNYAVEVYPQQQQSWKPLYYYFELETHFIDILQCRNLKIEERLAFLAETVSSITSLPQDETIGRELTALFNRNYDLLDKLVADKPTEQLKTETFLLENFLVNFIFRKPFYIYGFEKTLQLLTRIWEQINNSPNIAVAIIQIELQYGHDRQSLLK